MTYIFIFLVGFFLGQIILVFTIEGFLKNCGFEVELRKKEKK